MSGHPVFSGILRAFVLAPGVVPLGLLVGAAAQANGFTVWNAALFSLTILAGATQFAVFALMDAGAGLLAALGIVGIMNARYFLLAFAALDIGRRSGLGRAGRVALAFGVVEESYALQAAWSREVPAPRAGLLAIPATLMVIWTSCTMIGFELGARLPSLEPWGLDYALPGIFVGLFGIFADSRPRFVAGVFAIVAGGILGVVGLGVAAALVVPPLIAYVAGLPKDREVGA